MFDADMKARNHQYVYRKTTLAEGVHIDFTYVYVEADTPATRGFYTNSLGSNFARS